MDGYNHVNIIKVASTQALLKWERADIFVAWCTIEVQLFSRDSYMGRLIVRDMIHKLTQHGALLKWGRADTFSYIPTRGGAGPEALPRDWERPRDEVIYNF